jgi:hydrogenase expression/formation protein HypE
MQKEEYIQLGHGGGGLLTGRFIEDEILARFGKGPLSGLPDGAVLPKPENNIVFSTDSFVVTPVFFPGGNIGHLAVHGTVNDIAVSGGRPVWLSLALILEEGFPFSSVRKILDSIKVAADFCNVKIATGDTKVVKRGQCDGIYINTAGIGELIKGFSFDGSFKDCSVIVSGTLGDHAMAVMAAREGLDADSNLKSDTASVHRIVLAIKDMAADIVFMRDPTRGGLAATLNEVANGKDIDIVLDAAALPVSRGAAGLAEVLGIDLLHVASEGRMVVICKSSAADAVVEAMKSVKEGRGAVKIGEVKEGRGRVLLKTEIGGMRLIDIPQGEILPRIC